MWHDAWQKCGTTLRVVGIWVNSILESRFSNDALRCASRLNVDFAAGPTSDFAMPDPVAQHRADAPRQVRCAVLTVSDTRTEATDTGGRAIAELISNAGHTVVGRTIVKDDPDLVRSAIERQCANPGVQVIVTNGGTGITSRDSTYEVVTALLQKRLDGFGELFRFLSYEQIGSAAMMSRAVAGLVAGRIVIALPGSEALPPAGTERCFPRRSRPAA